MVTCENALVPGQVILKWKTQAAVKTPRLRRRREAERQRTAPGVHLHIVEKSVCVRAALKFYTVLETREQSALETTKRHVANW